MPSGLMAWQESAVAVLVGVLLAGPRLMVVSLMSMVVIQLSDDWLDQAEDGYASSILSRLDRVERLSLWALALCLMFMLTPHVSAWILVNYVLLEILHHKEDFVRALHTVYHLVFSFIGLSIREKNR